MSWDGMLGPPGVLTCKRCNRHLNPNGDRPAEVYAGTFTGLCYACQDRGAEIIATDPLDGAICIEYPPHCPSYRRDRESYWGYADCQRCNGKCSIVVPRDFGNGGPYRQSCSVCWEKYHNNPVRKWTRDKRQKISRIANEMFCREIKNRRKKLKLKKNDLTPESILNEIRAPLLKKVDRIIKHLDIIACKIMPTISYSGDK